LFPVPGIAVIVTSVVTTTVSAAPRRLTAFAVIAVWFAMRRASVAGAVPVVAARYPRWLRGGRCCCRYGLWWDRRRTCRCCHGHRNTIVIDVVIVIVVPPIVVVVGVALVVVVAVVVDRMMYNIVGST